MYMCVEGAGRRYKEDEEILWDGSGWELRFGEEVTME